MVKRKLEGSKLPAEECALSLSLSSHAPSLLFFFSFVSLETHVTPVPSFIETVHASKIVQVKRHLNSHLFSRQLERKSGKCDEWTGEDAGEDASLCHSVR